MELTIKFLAEELQLISDALYSSSVFAEDDEKSRKMLNLQSKIEYIKQATK